MVAGIFSFAHGLLDDLRSALERYTRGKIKRNRDRRELALVIDRERDVGNLVVGNAAQRHHLPVRRANEDLVKRPGIS